MSATYTTIVLGYGNHASIEIPETELRKIGGNKRAPLKITVNGHTYQSTATGKNGKCFVVFPMRNRVVAGVDSGDTVKVTLELDAGFREVTLPNELSSALREAGLMDKFDKQIYSRRKEFARQVDDAKAVTTKIRRIEKIIAELSD